MGNGATRLGPVTEQGTVKRAWPPHVLYLATREEGVLQVPTGGESEKKVTPWASIWHFHRTVPAMSHPLIIRRPSPRPPSSLPPGSHIISCPHLAIASWFDVTIHPIHLSLSLPTYIVTNSPPLATYTYTRTLASKQPTLPRTRTRTPQKHHSTSSLESSTISILHHHRESTEK